MTCNPLPAHFLQAESGELYDTRGENWSAKPLRPFYAVSRREITTSRALAASLRAGPYTFPGGYAVAYFTADGGTLCPDCVRDNFRECAESYRHRYPDWLVVGMTHSGEQDCELTCDHCGETQ